LSDRRVILVNQDWTAKPDELVLKEKPVNQAIKVQKERSDQQDRKDHQEHLARKAVAHIAQHHVCHLVIRQSKFFKFQIVNHSII
jgi:uncharacterized protein YecA (UPF0149 family)